MKESSRRSEYSIIMLFSTFSVLLLLVAWYASGLAPRMMERNYRSVKYSAEMQSALVKSYLSAVNGEELSPQETARFQESLNNAQQNLTEAGERELVSSLDTQWRAFRLAPATPTLESFQQLANSLEALSALNERSMKQFEERAVSLGKSVLFGGVLGFALVLVYSIQITLRSVED